MRPHAVPEHSEATPHYTGSTDHAVVVGRLLVGMHRTRRWVTSFGIAAFLLSTFTLIGARATPHLAFSLLSAAAFLVGGQLLWSYRGSIDSFLASTSHVAMLPTVVHERARHWQVRAVVAAAIVVLDVALLSYLWGA
jgi:hypothetical protein